MLLRRMGAAVTFAKGPSEGRCTPSPTTSVRHSRTREEQCLKVQ